MKALGTHNVKYGFLRSLLKTKALNWNNSCLVRKMTYHLVCNVIPTLLILIGVGWFSILAVDHFVQATVPETAQVTTGQQMPEGLLSRAPAKDPTR